MKILLHECHLYAKSRTAERATFASHFTWYVAKYFIFKQHVYTYLLQYCVYRIHLERNLQAYIIIS